MAITQHSPSASLDGITLGADGLAICAGRPDTCGDPHKPDDPVDFTVVGAPGEPMRFMFASADGKYRAADMIVPSPLIGTDHACSLEALRGTAHGELVILRGVGFAPLAKIKLASDSGGERHTEDITADGQGGFITALLPAVQGQRSGTLATVATTEACRPRVSIQWGAGSYYGK